MSSYLQRLALNVLEPRESIRPVLGSLFSGANSHHKSGAVPLQTERPVAAPDPFESVPQTTPPLDDPKTLSPDREPDAEDKKSPQLIPATFSGSNQPALVPGLKEKTLAFTAHNLPAKRENEGDEEVPGTSQSEAVEWTLDTRAVENQTPKIAPSELTEFTDRSTPAADSAPLVSKSRGKTETPVIPPLVVRGNDQQQSESLKRQETFANTLPTPGTKPAPEQSSADASVPKLSRGSAAKQGATAVTKQAFRTSILPMSDPDGKEGSPSLRTTQREPDEIQIHIGRIEVIAVPPAPPALPSPKRKHETPSLSEYLQRRNGRSV